jgi:PAS domain S-box-containing protein
VFVALSVVTTTQAVRRPTRASVDTALLFGAVGVAVLQSWAVQLLGITPGPGLRFGTTFLVLTLPYLLLRLLDDYLGVRFGLLRLAEAALVALGVLVITVEPPLPGWAFMAIVIYFAGLEIYAAVRFARGAARARGITRSRMQAVGIGSACLGVAVVVAGVQALVPTLAQPWIVQLLAIGSGCAYFVGFAPPGLLKRAWQEPELRAFLRGTAELPRLQDRAAILRTLELAVARAVGALDARIVLGEAADAAQPDDAVGLSAPITAGGTRLGVLTVSGPRRFMFAEDDLALVRLLADHVALALGYAELRESEIRNAAIVATALDAVVGMNDRGHIIEFNPAAESMFGYTRAEVLDRPLADVIIPSRLRGQHRQGLARYLATGDCRVLGKLLELSAVRADGTEFPVELAIARIAVGGSPVFTGFIRDLTARVRGEEALRRLAAIVESSPDAIISTTPEGIVTSWNPGAERLFGYTAEEMLGREAASLIVPPECRQERSALADTFGQAQPITEFETVRLHKSGRRMDISLSLSSIRDANGNTASIATIARDISGRKQAEATRSRLAAIVEASDDAIIGKTLEGVITSWNRGAERLYGYTATEVVGQSIDLVIPEDRRDELLHILDRLRHGQRIHHLETRRQRKDGTLLDVVVSISPIYDRSGTIVGVATIARDITGRKQAEARIAALNAQLEQRVQERTAQLEHAIKELEAFSYSVSHDLRAPLRAVDGFSCILLEEHAPKLDPEAQGYLRLVSENAQHMGQLIDDLLAFSRLSRQPARKQLVAPEPLVRQVLRDLAPELDGRQVHITIGDLPACQADPALLRQVYVNLISNALKFTRRRPEPHVEVGSDQRDGSVTYFVKDDGTGFDMRYANKLFGVFQRLHRAEDYDGTGVGLAIVERIVHRHGGRVWAEAAPEQGATFFFTLEGAPADAEARVLPDGRSVHGSLRRS